MRRAISWVGLFVAATSVCRAEDAPLPSSIRPILVKCLACHNAEDVSGDLDLSTRALALKGGETGPSIKPGDPDGSLLLQLVKNRKMPPKKPLSADETEALRKWIKDGAPWTEDLSKAPKQADADSPRWAFHPVTNPPTPSPKLKGWSRDPIDDFILEKLEEKGLKPSSEAGRRVWLRRVTFDLIGLPPTPQELDAFENDRRWNAHEIVVDRLLDSPHYGERWARHWLDLARFGESQGFEYDHMRDNAWPYRDYVIRSFNQDKPYAQFIREQIAGDVAEPVTADGIIATGFLVAGPWDQAGSGQANKIAVKRIREEELEDMVGVVGQTFLGLTVQCARCHSHKFDPIPQKDYYRLKSAFEGIGHGDRPAVSNSHLERKLGELERLAREKAVATKTGRAKQDRPKPLAAWTFESSTSDVEGGLPGTLIGKARVEGGRLVLPGGGSYYQSEMIRSDLREKTLEAWVVLGDLAQRGGAAISIEKDGGGVFDAIVFGEREPGKWMAGSNSFARTKAVDGPVETEAGRLVHAAIVYEPNGTITLYRDGKPYGKPYRPEGPGSSLQRYPKGESHILLGLRHSVVANGFLSGAIEEARLYDRALSPAEVAASHQAGPEKISAEEIEKALDPPARRERRDLIARIEAERKKFKTGNEIPKVYAAQPFQPAPTQILARGDVESAGETVSAGGLSSVHGPASDFGLEPGAPEAERRIKLAAWIADPRNPLPARVLVNRLWHYHFGTGLVATPSDFGANGGRPSHPALLDRLASDFLAGGGRIKAMQKRIVLSATYRQGSAFDAKSAAIDAEARLLWRFPPRRIEGEAVLDAMRAVSGRLNPAVGGKSFQPFTVTKFGSSFYHLTDDDSPEFRRRMIYRMQVHSARTPLMESLDCPDPSTKTAKRNSTVTPLQALALMNDKFVDREAKYFAERARKEAGADLGKQVDQAYLLALSRLPRDEEREAAVRLAREHSLDRLAWALLNANEFLYLR